MGAIAVGDRVRSYDFPGDTEWYAEGVVEGIAEIHGCPRYILRADLLVQGGEPKVVDPFVVYPPVNGTRTLFGRVCQGVVKIVTDLSR